MAYAEEIDSTVSERNVRNADDLPSDLVARVLARGDVGAEASRRPGPGWALLFYSCIPITGEWAFGPWPDGVPVQIHGMDADPIRRGGRRQRGPGDCRDRRRRRTVPLPR